MSSPTRRCWAPGTRRGGGQSYPGLPTAKRRGRHDGWCRRTVRHQTAGIDQHDYDIDYYVRLLRTSYAERLARAFRPEDFATVFADADQFPLFAPSIESIHSVLTPLRTPDRAVG